MTTSETPAEPTLPRCPICREPIEPGDSVIFSIVFGERQAVHLRCGDEAARRRAAEDERPSDQSQGGAA